MKIEGNVCDRFRDCNLKKLTLFFAILGLIVTTLIVAWSGVDPVLHAVLSIGFYGFCAIVLCQLLVDGILGLAWHVAFPELGYWRLVGARMVRDAVGSCLPLSQVGGMVLGVRATCLRVKETSPNIYLSEATGANLVDITTEVMGQVAFILLAIIFLVTYRGFHPLVMPIMGGALFLVVGSIGFIWTQRNGGRLLRRFGGAFVRKMTEKWQNGLLDSVDAAQDYLEQAWSHPLRIAMAASCHFLGWLGSAGILWVTAWFLGASLTFFQAVAIEGVACAIMSVGFFIPAGLGVQEGAYMVIGHVFDISAPIALGFSLLRRGRELTVGISVLLIWQFLEMRSLHAEHCHTKIENAKAEQFTVTPVRTFVYEIPNKEEGDID